MSRPTAKANLPYAIGKVTSVDHVRQGRVESSRADGPRSPKAPRVSERDARAAEEAEAELDPRFVRRHGFLIFTGEVSPDAIPDHRAIQDERIDALVADADARHL
jgi:hypothetical protein